MKARVVSLLLVALALVLCPGRLRASGAQAKKKGPSKSLFARIDSDGDGAISREEFRAYQKSLRAAGQKPAAQKRAARKKDARKKDVAGRRKAALKKDVAGRKLAAKAKAAKRKAAARRKVQRPRAAAAARQRPQQGRRVRGRPSLQRGRGMGMMEGVGRAYTRWGRRRRGRARVPRRQRRMGRRRRRAGAGRRCPCCGMVVPGPRRAARRAARRGAVGRGRRGRSEMDWPVRGQQGAMRGRSKGAPGAAGRGAGAPARKGARGGQRQRRRRPGKPAPDRRVRPRGRGRVGAKSAVEPSGLASEREVLDNWQMLAELGLVR